MLLAATCPTRTQVSAVIIKPREEGNIGFQQVFVSLLEQLDYYRTNGVSSSFHQAAIIEQQGAKWRQDNTNYLY